MWLQTQTEASKLSSIVRADCAASYGRPGNLGKNQWFCNAHLMSPISTSCTRKGVLRVRKQ